MPLFFQRVVNEKLIYNTNQFVLQELRKACGAGFLIIINYIYNQLHLTQKARTVLNYLMNDHLLASEIS